MNDLVKCSSGAKLCVECACLCVGEPTCQSLRHRQRVHRRVGSRVNVVLLRHLVVQVEQHGVDRAQGVSRTRSRTAGRPAEIHGVHSEAETWTDRYLGMDRARI